MGVISCVVCAAKVNDQAVWCQECGHDPRTGAASPAATAAAERREANEIVVGVCPSCGAELRLLGRREFALRGAGAATHFLLGDLAHLGDDAMALEVLYCRACRHVEFRLPEGVT